MTARCDIAQINHLLLHARRMITALRQGIALERRRVGIPANDSETEFLSLLENISNVLESYLESKYVERAEELAHSSAVTRSDERHMQRLELRLGALIRIGSELTELLGELYGTTREVNIWSLASIDRLCRHLYPSSRVIVRPRWRQNYTFFPLSTWLEATVRRALTFDLALADELVKALRESSFYFVLSFPSTAVRDVLALATWAHEVGHFIDRAAGVMSDSHRNGADSDSLYGPTTLSSDAIARVKLKIPDDINVGQKDAAGEWVALAISYATGWASEIFADLISVRLIGPAALFAFVDFVRPMSFGFGASSKSPRYPPLTLRLKIMYQALQRWNAGYPQWVGLLPPKIRIGFDKEMRYIERLISADESGHQALVELPEWAEQREKTVNDFLLANHTRIVTLMSDTVEEFEEQRGAAFLRAEDLVPIGSKFHELESQFPITFGDEGLQEGESDAKGEDPRHFALVLNTGWLYWSSLFPHTGSQPLQTISPEHYDSLNGILLKSLEHMEALRWYNTRGFALVEGAASPAQFKASRTAEAEPGPGVLAGDSIRNLIASGRLIVRPLLDDSQVGTASLDIRLGTSVTLTEPLGAQLALDQVDLTAGAGLGSVVDVPLGKAFTLHPGQLALASSLEYLALPADVTGVVYGRHSWQRLGLVTSTAVIDPGFNGALAMVLTNTGQRPIPLYPCVRIAKVVLMRTS